MKVPRLQDFETIYVVFQLIRHVLLLSLLSVKKMALIYQKGVFHQKGVFYQNGILHQKMEFLHQNPAFLYQKIILFHQKNGILY